MKQSNDNTVGLAISIDADNKWNFSKNWDGVSDIVTSDDSNSD